jgi:hypothetical protein
MEQTRAALERILAGLTDRAALLAGGAQSAREPREEHRA